MSAHTVTIGPDGTIAFIYADALAPLLDLGAASVVRASDVEPAPGGGWIATMRDGGEVLGPFRLRQEALDAEVAHLQRTRGL